MISRRTENERTRRKLPPTSGDGDRGRQGDHLRPGGGKLPRVAGRYSTPTSRHAHRLTADRELIASRDAMRGPRSEGCGEPRRQPAAAAARAAAASVCPPSRSRLRPWVSKCVRGAHPSSAAAVHRRRRPTFPSSPRAPTTCRFEQHGQEKPGANQGKAWPCLVVLEN